MAVPLMPLLVVIFSLVLFLSMLLHQLVVAVLDHKVDGIDERQ